MNSNVNYSYVCSETRGRPMNGTLYIVRGTPGSGKSTYAHKLALEKGIPHFESDFWFIDPVTLEYKFDLKKLNYCHQQCAVETETALIADGSRGAVVSNTFTKFWEMEDYIQMAAFWGFNVEIIEMRTQFGNIHNVPEETLKKMAARFVPNELLPKFHHVTFRHVD